MKDTRRRRADDHRNDLLRRITRAARRLQTPLASRRELDSYIARFHANVAVEDLEVHSPDELAAAAVGHLQLAERRRSGQAKLRIFNPDKASDGWSSTHTIIELVNDDMPFLVDSVAMAVERVGLGLHLTIHPVIALRRRATVLEAVTTRADSKARPESFIRLEIDRISFRATLSKLEAEIRRTLDDVRAAVRDWRAMRDRMCGAANIVASLTSRDDPTLASESAHLLEWMVEDHFTFLGFQEYRLKRDGRKATLLPISETGLGLLHSSRHDATTIELSPAMRREAVTSNPLIITKANSRSTVHRGSYLDYIGVKQFDARGRAIGEWRFLGLFTSLAYSQSPSNIPLLRLKVHRVLAASGVDPAGHRGKALAHILDNYPRDELLQTSIDDLARTTSAILGLQDRRQVRLFLRRDTFLRFFSCLIYVPKEKYNTRVRLEIERILMDAFDGTGVESSVEISDSTLARLHSIVRTDTASSQRVSISAVEARLADAVVTWQDKLREALVDQYGEEDGLDFDDKYGEAFPLAYEEDISPAEAARDLCRLHRVFTGTADVSDRYVLDVLPGDGELSFKVFSASAPLALSDALPVLENLGVRVLNERPYGLTLPDGQRFTIQDFTLARESAEDIDIATRGPAFARAFANCVSGRVENDGLNRLVLRAGLSAIEVTVVRAYTKYLLQLGIPFSQSYMEQVLAENPTFARAWVDAFAVRFDPTRYRRGRRGAIERTMARLDDVVEQAVTLDEDRILRAFAAALTATVRTNHYQQPRDDTDVPTVLALKLMPESLSEAPQPRPRFEIFIYSTRVEGVHLRADDIARGGIRWSERREDFRTEILGLMKAQTVKNTVIVPSGAKGGFVCKSLPTDRSAAFDEVVRCYKAFIGGLLSVTDNIRDGQLVPPTDTVRHDDNDPYLVVAADKGTATFSDIANELSQQRGFWLDDAFASGGSAGYDHKKMGITARGAWEAVKRHFREMGINTQRDPFTVLAIGDMGGDVFGNGMLLSRKIKLRAAFNHRHIFIDPDPDPAASYRERRRLFRAPDSGWDAYDPELISTGGGVFSRAAKRISLSADLRAWLGTDRKAMSPTELINALLKAPVDLLWNGGIGTYVKATSESDADVGDRANNTLRVNATELGCRVVGEGGNLGLTQKARIQFALGGGKINTDFIDNSAGVDSSDREVNIKILLGMIAAAKKLPRGRRNKLLASMTDAVAELVLRNNYLQTQAISMVESRASERLREHVELMRQLEGRGLLNRTLESMPDEESIKERSRRNLGLTRPEIAVLLSYAKIDLYNSLIGRSIVRQQYHADELSEYFPPPLPTRYRDWLLDHRLSNQILLTRIVNSIVNRMGPAFARRMQQDTGASAVAVARAYAVVRDITRARELWAAVEALDNKVDTAHQYEMMFEVARRLRHASYWLLRHRGQTLAMDAGIAEFGPPLDALYPQIGELLPGKIGERFAERIEYFAERGVEPDVAERIAGLARTTTLLDIIDVARNDEADWRLAAELYFELDRRLTIDWLKRAIEAVRADSRWQAVARSKLRDTVNDSQRELTRALLANARRIGASDAVASWFDEPDRGAKALRSTLRSIRRSGQADFATLSVAVAELHALIPS
ncbi:MAG: NAD-glutamate dehydrogenase [Pseudomonadota bacterium]